MAKTRKSEPDVMVSAAAAVPARSRTVTARKPRPATSKTPAAMVESVAAPYSPAQEEIEVLAYSYWVTRGYQGGSPEEDWLRAERELLQRAL
jgi:hypothetical protein